MGTSTSRLSREQELLAAVGATAAVIGAAVVAHTAPGGAAYLMCVKGRPGVDAFPDALLQRHCDVHGGGDNVQVETEEMCVMQSFGAADLVLVSYRRLS